MAYKTLVTDALFVQTARAIQLLSNKYGPIKLGMLVPSTAGHSDKWNLVISAEWIDQSGIRRSIELISNALLRNLSKQNLLKIERISALPTGESFIESMLRDIGMDIEPGTPYRVHSFELAHLGVTEAIILVAASSKRGYRNTHVVQTGS